MRLSYTILYKLLNSIANYLNNICLIDYCLLNDYL